MTQQQFAALALASLQHEFAAALAEIQMLIGGRVGAYMLDTQSQLELAFNARERFAMCSTFKAHAQIGGLFAAAVARQ